MAVFSFLFWVKCCCLYNKNVWTCACFIF